METDIRNFLTLKPRSLLTCSFMPLIYRFKAAREHEKSSLVKKYLNKPFSLKGSRV